MPNPRGPARAFALLGFAVGTALVAAFVAAAFAVPVVRVAASLAAPLVPIVLFGAPVAGLVIAAVRARRGAPLSPSGDTASDGSSRRDAFVSGLAIPAATFAFVLVLFETWSRAQSNGSYAGGLVPVSDAGAYFAGAERLLDLGTLDGWNSRRPLNAALLVTRIALADGDFRGALLLQAALLGATTTLAARALAKDFGRNAGLLLFAGLYVFGSIFVATTMSESLGLSLGSLAFALLWHAMRTRRITPMAAGFAVCAMALNARSGAFLVLPCLAVWAALTQGEPRTDDRVDVLGVVAAILGTAVGFGINAAIAALYGGASGGTHSNFSYTLYGLAKGGTGWERAMADFPALRTMGDAEAGTFVYARALEQVEAHPLDLAVGLLRNVECFVLSTSEKLSLGLLDGHPAAEWAFALVWGAGVAYLVVRTFRVHGADRGLLLLTAAAVGVAGSVPVIYMDGRERVFAASVPFVIAAAAVALTALGPGARRVVARTPFEHVAWVSPAMTTTALVVVLAVAGPRVSHDLFAPTGAEALGAATSACDSGRSPLRVAGRDGLPRIDVVDAARVEPAPLAPEVAVEPYKRGIARDVNLGTTPFATELAALKAGDTLISVFDLGAERTRHLVVPTSSLPILTSTAIVCADVGAAPVVRATPVVGTSMPSGPPVRR